MLRVGAGAPMFAEGNHGVAEGTQPAPESRNLISFNELSLKISEELEEISYPVRYPGKVTLFAEGEPPRGIFIIRSGRIKMFICSNHGRTLVLRLAGPSDVIGLPGTLSGRRYEVTAETLLPCELLFVKRQPFLRFMHAHKEVCIAVVDQLTKIYGSACHEMRCLGLSQSADEKIAKLLLEWPLNGSDTPSRIKFVLTHEDLAQMIGSARETVTRVFAEFKKKHILEQNGSTLYIHDRVALRKLAANLLPIPEDGQPGSAVPHALANNQNGGRYDPADGVGRRTPRR